MKNALKLIGLIVLAAVIGFSMTACDNAPDNTSTTDDSSTPDDTPTVASVTVSPATATVAKGATQTFTADVTVTNNAAKTVIWSIVQTNKNAGTTINASGVLTVAAAETLTSLTVRATSTVDDKKSGTATVTVSGGDIAVTFNSVSQNGSVTQTTTQLTLVFSQAITGLSAADITLTGVSNINKGTLGSSGSTYTLPISGFTAGGNLNVAVSKTGYNISGSPKPVTIYYYTSNPPPAAPLSSKWPFYVGAAVPGSAFSSSDGQYPLLRHFNVLVAENDMKPESVMPNEWQNWQSSPAYNASNAYRWTEADKLVNYAQANNTKIRGHVLFWHEQTPGVFFKTGNLSSAYVSKEVFYTRMEQHVKTVFQKYGGKVLWWDLANETVGSDGNPRVEGGANVAGSDGKSGFTAVMEAAGLTGDNRYEWIVNAFKYARKHADENGGQNVKLFLTEYDIEKNYSTVKRDGFLRLLDYLISNGAPIDGVGIQGHTRVQERTGYVTSLGSLIDQIATRKNPVNNKNLVVQVTELDISLYAWDDSSLTLSTSELNSRLQTQTAMYRELFDMFNDKYKEGKFDMVVVWGIDDGHSWMNGFPTAGRVDYPLLFDRQYKPKPAFDSLITGPKTEETVKGSFNAYAGNSFNSLSSSVNYQVVDLPGESRTNVLKVVNPGEWAVALYDLTGKKGQNITVTFSAQVKRVGAAGTLNWQINNSDYPSVGTPINNAAEGTWHSMSGTWTGTPTDNGPKLYLSTHENNSASTTYYISNFTITVTP